jgi:hypothetical protein
MSGIDNRGRIGDRALLRALGWAPGTRLTVEVITDLMVAVRAAPVGALCVSARGHLQLPAAVRHRLGLHGGDRLLLAIDVLTGRLPDPSTTPPAGGPR